MVGWVVMEVDNIAEEVGKRVSIYIYLHASDAAHSYQSTHETI